MWNNVEKGFQAAFEMAWEAFKEDTVPIGAVIQNETGEVIAAARNQISAKGGGIISNHQLAHAETNAILMLSEDEHPNIRKYTLYTTTEPCPFCFGAIVMGSIRKAKFAQRDPWAGAAELNAKMEYASVIKGITFDGPYANEEAVQLALFVIHRIDVFETRRHDRFVTKYENTFGRLIPVSMQIARDGEVKRMAENGAGIGEVYDFILEQI